MKHFNNIATACCALSMGLLALTGCEDEHFYEVGSPDWISEKVDSIANSQSSTTEEVLVGMEEDVYTIGNNDYTSGWWTSFSKYYVVPDGQKWNAVFNLHVNPDDNTYYKNFALIVTNDYDRGDTSYQEYGAIRFDTTNDTLTYNSQWGNYLWFRYTTSNQLMSPEENLDAGLQNLGGRVTLTVDRSVADTFLIRMSNANGVVKTYTQPHALPNLNADAGNTNIRCFVVPEGSYIDFLQSNVEPIGGYTSADDKQPVSMVLQNVPATVSLGTSLEEAMAEVTALVTYEEGVTSTVSAADLVFTAVPDMETPGEKSLVAVYSKTVQGANADSPITATATFTLEDNIVALAVTSAPTLTYFMSDGQGALPSPVTPFALSGIEVTATYSSGSTAVVDNSRLTFSAVQSVAGIQTVTVSMGDVSTTVDVNVSEVAATAVQNSASVVGLEDNTTGWWSAFSDDFNVPSGETRAITFTNYTNCANNWNNFLVILRNSAAVEAAVLRADNFGWGGGYDGNANLVLSGGQADWAAWLTDMNGAKVTIYVNNVGDGTANVWVSMQGASGTDYVQYYLGITTVDPADLNFALTTEGGHLVF